MNIRWGWELSFININLCPRGVKGIVARQASKLKLGKQEYMKKTQINKINETLNTPCGSEVPYEYR